MEVDLDEAHGVGELRVKEKDQQRAQVVMGVDVTEVYSPERVTAMAQRMGMKGGWAFDLTTADEDGRPWNLSDPVMQKKAMKKIIEDDPFVLIGSPPCTALSRVQFSTSAAEVFKRRKENCIETSSTSSSA